MFLRATFLLVEYTRKPNRQKTKLGLCWFSLKWKEGALR